MTLILSAFSLGCWLCHYQTWNKKTPRAQNVSHTIRLVTFTTLVHLVDLVAHRRSAVGGLFIVFEKIPDGWYWTLGPAGDLDLFGTPIATNPGLHL